jgi:hypothetical protein
MKITLDNDQWEATHSMTLGEILADLSERAHAQSRIVTTVTLDRRRITDRDIDPTLLQESSGKYRELVATSATQQAILESAQGAIDRFRELVVEEGTSLVGQLRLGMQDLSLLDLWLGKVADVVEIIGNGPKQPGTESPARVVAGWMEEFLEARRLRDTVRMADLLEYEVLPRLSH